MEKELGLDTEGMKLKDIKAILKAHKEAEDAKKTELEKLQGKNQGLEGELSATKAELLKLKLAIDAQIPADKLPKVLKYVNGSTEDEIGVSIAEIKADWGITESKTPNAAQGAGQTGVPGQKQSEIATMSRSELVEKSKNRDWYEANRDAILDRLQKI